MVTLEVLQYTTAALFVDYESNVSASGLLCCIIETDCRYNWSSLWCVVLIAAEGMLLCCFCHAYIERVLPQSRLLCCN